MALSLDEPKPPDTQYFFKSMFNSPGAFQFNAEALDELAKAMENDADEDSSIPAGYTYLAQFITHDISFFPRKKFPTENVDGVTQQRNPTLNLDSLYGGGPTLEPKLYEADRIHLKVGTNRDSDLKNDLPRDKDNPNNPALAIIADERNDENLAVAQTHVAFLRFHNAVVDKLLKDGISQNELFDEARKKVIQHYQWIILHDFLPKIVDKEILQDVLANGTKYLKANEDMFVPTEFAFAAFRIGHSMVANEYNWNRNFQKARLGEIMRFTGITKMRATGKPLPQDWIIDWRRFYHFEGEYIGFNRAKKINTFLTSQITKILRAINSNSDFPSLTKIDLYRGNELSLPTGQAVAKWLNVAPLSADEIAEGSHKDILKKYKLDINTPLYYYILKEAELGGGERLGNVGSRIVVETIVWLIQKSDFSILKERNFKPTLGENNGKFDMTDLLKFADVVNPLG